MADNVTATPHDVPAEAAHPTTARTAVLQPDDDDAQAVSM